MVDDSMRETDADAVQVGHPEFDIQQVVIAGCGFVAQAAFNYRENDVRLLPFEERFAEAAEEFATRFLQQIEVSGIINMVTQSAFSVSNAVVVTKFLPGHAQEIRQGIKKRNTDGCKLLHRGTNAFYKERAIGHALDR